MFEKLDQVEQRYENLALLLGDPNVIQNPKDFQKYAKEHASLSELVETYKTYKKVIKELEDNKELLEENDPDIKKLAREEIERLEREKNSLEERLKILLLPVDPNDDKNILLEIRAGTGGEEASLFVADLVKMYSKYAELKRGWKVEIMSSHPTELGGFKEIILLIEGKGAYSRFKYESGVHRVQRVPITETQGRIHTSAVTVAVLPEAEEVEVVIDEKDIRVDVFRSSGHGGQSVNTTDSAVRITHLPTNIVVSCQDEKSQHKNKAKALRILKTRLYEKLREEQQNEISTTRKNQIGTGDRSEKIRTYNFKEGRVTDHRISLTIYRLDEILEGELDMLIDPLIAYFQAEALKEQSKAA